jgi:ferric-dicitrate binding protein FerR (iron transport regulator)
VEETEEELRLLTRHLSGVATPEEKALLRAWLDANPARKRTLARIQEIWETPMNVSSRYDTDAAWARFRERIQRVADAPAVPAGVSPPFRARRRPARPTFPWARLGWSAAAALFLAVGAAVLWRSVDPGANARLAMPLEITVPRGQKALLRLPDGSQVVLAAASKLRYPRDFGSGARELELEGMAYFEVTHHPDQPFIVHARGASTRVLGTKFVIRAYPESSRVEVAVSDGSVSLRADSVPLERGIALTRGEVGRVGSDGIARIERGNDASAYFAWMKGQPVIQDLSLREALAELERWYDVTLAVHEPQLASRRITTAAGRASLNETLEAVALALDAHYVQQGDTLVFLSN